MATAKLTKHEKTLMDCIEAGKGKAECLAALGVKGEATLMKRLQVLQQKTGKVYNIKGLTSADNEVRWSGPSIIIHGTKLDGSPFESGDSFEIEWDDNSITLTKK